MRSSTHDRPATQRLVRRLLGTAACGTVLVIAGCSSDDASSTTSTAASTTTSTTAASTSTSTSTSTSGTDGATTSSVQSGPIDPGMVPSGEQVVTSLEIGTTGTFKP